MSDGTPEELEEAGRRVDEWLRKGPVDDSGPLDTGERHWNYRVVHQVHGDEHSYVVVEAHYRDGVLEMWSDATTAYGDSLDDLRGDLIMMAAATLQPVLEFDEMPGFALSPLRPARPEQL